MNILKELKNRTDELDPAKHDGSYELVQKVVKAYSELDSIATIGIADLDLLYSSTVGTWSRGYEVKKRLIARSSLTDAHKNSLAALLDNLKDRALDGDFSNADKKGSIGMFGSGFSTFSRNSTPDVARRMLKLCIKCLPVNSDTKLFDMAKEAIGEGLDGIQSACFSTIMHCLKPYTFPIINGAMGQRTKLYEMLGINLKSPKKLNAYIENSKEILAFRNANYKFKNFRVLDMASWDIEKEEVVNKAAPYISPDEILTSDNCGAEGARFSITVNAYERSPELREACLRHYFRNGDLACQICGFSFSETYGNDGEGIIDVHHITPLGEINAKHIVDPKTDLLPVCSNCHRMIHSKRPACSVEDIEQLLMAQQEKDDEE